MEDRDEALDFIYKGWREGRQQRRNVMNQRGADRIAARRERMANYGSTNMPFQVPDTKGVIGRGPKSGPPSRRNVASSPPSSEPYVSPVQQYLEREGLHQPQEQTSSTSSSTPMLDDITTLDNESTTQNEAIQDTVSSPPSMDNQPMPLETAMARLDRDMGGTGATRSTYDPTSPKPTQANVQTSPDEAFSRPAEQLVQEPVQEEPKKDISESLDIIDGKIPYNLDGQRIPERPAPTGMGVGEYEETYPTVRPAKPDPPERYQAPEMPYMKPSVEGYKKKPITTLKPDGGSGEAVPEKTATLTPVKRLKPVEQQHKDAFETAYNEMTGDEMRGMNQAMNRGIDEAFAAANREAQKLGREDEKLKETERKQRENKEREEDIERLKQGPLKLEEPKPDEKVSQAAKNTIKPAEKKATKKGKDAVREASERLANAGMKGKKSEEPKKPKKAAGKKKAKVERQRQDLTGIKKPDDSELRRSADQQMLADVLLKKLPVADLRMVNTMLGGGVNLPVLVDDMGFITQGQAVDPSHIMMTGISDNPNPFETDIDPRLLFDLDKLKIRASPTRFPGIPAMTTSRNKLLEAMTDVPMKRVQRLDDKGKYIPTGKKDKFGKPTYEMESVEDEDIGFFIRDGKNKKRMTPEEATEILDSRKKAKSQPQVKIDFASPYWSENQWNIPITSAGKTSTLPNVFGMMQTSEGADPNQRERSFIPDPRRSSSSSVDWSGLKEVASISPADFKRRINEVKDDMVRIGDAKFDAEYLKQIAQAMKPSDMANEDIVLTGMQNAPLFFAGRGVKRYDEEPSYFETILAPRVDDMANRHELLGNEYGWESMNDLFE